MLKQILKIMPIFFVAISVNAETISTTEKTKITRVSSYSEWGRGDVVIKVENPAPGCNDGFWLGGNDAGTKNILAIILSAKATGTKVSINGDKDRMWNGTSGYVCHLYAISF